MVLHMQYSSLTAYAAQVIWRTPCICSSLTGGGWIAYAANLCVVTDPEPTEPKHPRNRNWRSWNVTKNRPIRISEGEWADYEVVCAADGTDRAKDIRAHVQQRIRAYRRKNPGAALPSDEAADSA